ncbi:MAG: inositol 2-dehydrogenase [Candidatus Omnitrophica bacterium]|nr:inositol 2-dehydrogenase [bacterium]MBV6482860.1 Myo-inositol 2-dehydrogenase [bacterium]MCE7907562.1 inositol 2-dehydrogenase [Candidatus Omnitrophica bacterium COP1]MCL4733506.1 inositol 2-dehydrogenase [Candidatus Omnitrophota bacterium]
MDATSSRKVRVGLIGAGRIGSVHAEHLAYRIEGVELAAICDIHLPSAEKCARKLDIPICSDTPEEILENKSIDAVVISSSTDTHATLIQAAAYSGKDIFCEKPIDHDLSGIDAALEAVRKAGVRLQIGFNRRFDPSFRHLREKVRSGRVGTPHFVRITSRDPAPPPIEYIKVSGGLFLDMSIHDFDMARYLIDSEVYSVFALGGVRIDPAIGDAGDIDTALISLQFENGVLASIDNSRQAVYGYDQRIEVFGSEGVILAENVPPHRTFCSDRNGVHGPLPLHFFMDRYIDSYIEEMRSFIESVRARTEPSVSGSDGKAPVVIGLAAQKSMIEKRPVLISEIQQGVNQS